MMGGLLMRCLDLPLALSDAEAPEPLDIVRGVVAPAALSATGERQRSEPLTEPEPARAYAKFVGSLANRECMLLLKHTPTLNLADKVL